MLPVSCSHRSSLHCCGLSERRTCSALQGSMLVCTEKNTLFSVPRRLQAHLHVADPPQCSQGPVKGSCTHTDAVQSGAVVVVSKVVDGSAVGRPGINQPRLLTHQLTRCTSIGEVVSTCCSSEGQLNPIHISAALSRCVQLVKKQQQALQHQSKLQHSLQPPQVQHVRHQPQLQSVPSGSGSSCHQQQPGQLQQLHRFVAWTLEQLLLKPHHCSSREISTALWCCAKLQYSPEPRVLSELLSRFADVLPGSSCQAMSVVLYSLAKLGYAPGHSWLDHLLLRMFKSVVTSQTTARKDLANYACGHLGQLTVQKLDTQQQAALQHMYNKQVGVQQHQSLVMWLQEQRQCSDSCQQHVQHQQQQPQHSSISQVLSNTIWALARLKQQAVAEVWLLPLLSLLCTQQQQQQALHVGSQVSMQSVANVLWACSHLLPARMPTGADQPYNSLGSALLQQHWQQELGISWGSRQQRSGHQAAVLAAVRLKAATLLESCKHQLHTAEPQELTMLISSCVALELYPSRQWQQRFWNVSAAAIHQWPSRWSIHECVSLLFGVAYLRMQPTGSWFAAVLSAVRPMLATATANHLSKTVWAVGTLRARPPTDWMSAVVQEFMNRLQHQHSSVSPAAVSMLVWGASRIGYQLPAAGVEVLMRTVADDVDSYGPHQLSKLLHGCSTLHLQLPHAWWTSVLHSFQQQLQDSTAADITMVLRTMAGLQRQQRHQEGQQQSEQLDWPGRQHRPADDDHHHSTSNLKAAAAAAAPTSHSDDGSRDKQMQANAASSSSSSSAGQLLYCESSLINALIVRAEQVLGHMTAVELSQTLYAAAKLGATLNPLAWSQAVNFTLPRQMHLLAPGDVCLLLFSLAQLQHAVHPRRALHKQLVLHSYRMLAAGRFKPLDLTALVWNYSRVFKKNVSAQQQQWVPPRSWVTAYTQAAGAQLHQFTGRQLGVMLRGLLLLGVLIDEEFLDMVSSMVDLRSATYSKYELAVVSSVLLQLQQAQLAGYSQQQQQQQQQQRQQQQIPSAAVPSTACSPAADTLAQEPSVIAALHNAILPMRAVTTTVEYSTEIEHIQHITVATAAREGSLVQLVQATGAAGASKRKVAVAARAGRV